MTASASPPRFGRPQIYALLLLAAFAAQCLWVIGASFPDLEENWYVERGLRLIEQHELPADNAHSPLIYLMAAVPLKLAGTLLGSEGRIWLVRLPFLFFGLLRGASLWYVARRLYNNRGGYMALALYCFSPRMVAEGSHVWPDVLAGWGFFGAIFTAIAMAHTLYALPGTLPWPRRWRRTVLMGIGLGIGVAAQFSVALAVPLAVLLMLYLVPGRRVEAMAMLALSCAIAAAILLASYCFSPSALADRMGQALVISPTLLPIVPSYEALETVLPRRDLALVMMLGTALLTWALWRRARYFGNTAPLMVAAVLLLLAPVFPGDPFRLWGPSVALIFMFIGGIFADLLETRRSRLVMALGVLLLLVNIGFSLQRTWYL